MHEQVKKDTQLVESRSDLDEAPQAANNHGSADRPIEDNEGGVSTWVLHVGN